MKTNRIALTAALVTLISIIAQALPALILGGWTTPATDIPEWLPTVGTVGQTVVFYELFHGILGAVIMFGLAGWLGYHIGHTRDLITDFAQIGNALLTGATIAVVLAWIGALLFSATFDLDLVGVLLAVTTLLQQYLSTAVVVVLTAIAAATYSTITANHDQPTNPTTSSDPATVADHSD